MKKRLIKEKINDYKSNAEIKDIIDIYHSKHSCSQTNKKDKLVSNKCDIQCSKKKIFNEFYKKKLNLFAFNLKNRQKYLKESKKKLTII